MCRRCFRWENGGTKSLINCPRLTATKWHDYVTTNGIKKATLQPYKAPHWKTKNKTHDVFQRKAPLPRDVTRWRRQDAGTRGLRKGLRRGPEPSSPRLPAIQTALPCELEAALSPLARGHLLKASHLSWRDTRSEASHEDTQGSSPEGAAVSTRMTTHGGGC